MYLAELLGNEGDISESQSAAPQLLNKGHLDSFRPRTRLARPEREALLQVFDELGAENFPRLLEQLRTSFEARRRLDREWVSVLKVPEEGQDRVLQSLHAYLYETLNSLLAAMGKD